MPVEVVTEADAAAHGNPYLEETSDSEVRRMSKSNVSGEPVNFLLSSFHLGYCCMCENWK